MLPLKDANPADPSRGGFGFGEWSAYQGGYHEGLDYNCGVGIDGDLGTPLLAVAPMQCVANESTTRGFGNHQWWVVTGGEYAGAYVHYAHALSFIYDVGATVERGAEIGQCGKSGGQYAAHLHLSIKRTLPPSWGYYAHGETREQVIAGHVDPMVFTAAYEGYEAEEDKMTDSEKALLATARECGYVETGAEILRMMAGLGANAESIPAWINELGAISAIASDLRKTVDELQDALAASTRAATEAANAAG